MPAISGETDKMIIRTATLFAMPALAFGLMAAALPTGAQAAGCLKGAAVGGVAGHVAGHHGVAGAAVGCAVGHHEASKKAKQQNQDSRPAGN